MPTNIGIVLLVSIKLVQTLRLNYSIPGPKSYNSRIGIVGAGSAGIHMALLLKQKGFKNIEVLESSGRTGGKSYTHHMPIYNKTTFYYISELPGI